MVKLEQLIIGKNKQNLPVKSNPKKLCGMILTIYVCLPIVQIITI